MWQVTLELAPWLLVGAAVAGAMHALLPPGTARRLLGGQGGVWKSVVAGVPLPLCSCAVIPVGLGLKRQGASDGASVAFLIATPQTGVDSVLVTAGMLGWPLALFKVATALVTGLVGGWLTNAVAPRQMSLPVIDAPTADGPPAPLLERLFAGMRHADELVYAIWRWLALGVVLSAAITVWAPADSLEGLAAYGLLAAMGATLALSLPLYVCATASAPIAASLVAAGLPLGAVIVFLMAGPATNVATVGAVYRGLGGRQLAVYLAVIIAGSVAGGVLFQFFFGETFSPSAVTSLTGHDHGHAWWQTASAVLLIAWIARCAWGDLRQRVSHHAQPSAAADGP